MDNLKQGEWLEEACSINPEAFAKIDIEKSSPVEVEYFGDRRIFGRMTPEDFRRLYQQDPWRAE